jgi:transposase
MTMVVAGQMYGLVVSKLGRDPLSGDCFLFTNRRRTRAKVLLWDGTGLCVYQNQLSSHYTSSGSMRAS